MYYITFFAEKNYSHAYCEDNKTYHSDILLLSVSKEAVSMFEKLCPIALHVSSSAVIALNILLNNSERNNNQ